MANKMDTESEAMADVAEGVNPRAKYITNLSSRKVRNPSPKSGGGGGGGAMRTKQKNSLRQKRKASGKRVFLSLNKTSKDKDKAEEEETASKPDEVMAQGESQDDSGDWSECSQDNDEIPKDLVDLFNSGMVFPKPSPKPMDPIKVDEPDSDKHTYVFEMDSDEEEEVGDESDDDASEELVSLPPEKLLKVNNDWARYYPDTEDTRSSRVSQSMVKFATEPVVHVLNDEGEDRRLDAEVLRSGRRSLSTTDENIDEDEDDDDEEVLLEDVAGNEDDKA